LPISESTCHFADIDSVFYLVHDEPLLRYLGAKANVQRFKERKFNNSYSQIFCGAAR